MLKSVLLLLAASPALSAKSHCPLTDVTCPTLCKKYKKEVPRPTVYNWCQIGCRGQISGAGVEGVCRFADLPRPTTTNACKDGYATAKLESGHCDKKKSDSEARIQKETDDAVAATAAAAAPPPPLWNVINMGGGRFFTSLVPAVVLPDPCSEGWFGVECLNGHVSKLFINTREDRALRIWTS